MRIASFVFAGLAAGAALSFAPSDAFAQSRGAVRDVPPTPLFDVTPYAGYMVFGDFASGPLGTSLGNAPAPIYGAQLGMRIAPNVSMIANLAASSSDIKAGIPVLGGLSVAHNAMVFYDAGLQLDIPVTSALGYTFSPFLQAGIGGMHYDISQSVVSTSATNLAYNLGAGADIAMGGNVGLQLMVKDYIGKFDFQEATSFDINSGTTHNVALSAGLRFSF